MYGILHRIAIDWLVGRTAEHARRVATRKYRRRLDSSSIDISLVAA